MKRISQALLTASLFAAAAGAQGQTFGDRVVSQLSKQGFTTTEVKNGPTQTKVEAVRGNTKLEVVYDRASGAIVKQEVERYRGRDDPARGIEVSDEDRDFAQAGSDRTRDDDDDRRSRKDGDERDDRDERDDHDDDHGDDHDNDHGDDHESDHGDDHDDHDSDHERGDDKDDD